MPPPPFFVISGFLITIDQRQSNFPEQRLDAGHTTLLMVEARAHGGISIKLPYSRRSLRIFSVSYVYIFVMGALAVRGAVRLTAPDRPVVASAGVHVV
jgi:peptidoglycan/LPS O-acetylase OafA/YrhL